MQESKCSGVWKAFEESLAASQLPSSYTRTVKVQAESLFFPVPTAEAFTPMKIYTLIQPSQATCKFVCGKPSGDSCLAVAGPALGLFTCTKSKNLEHQEVASGR